MISIVVVNIRSTSVGLIVDSVKEVLDIPGEQIDPPPNVNKSAESRYIIGLGKLGESVKIILGVDRLLYDEELDLISGVE